MAHFAIVCPDEAGHILSIGPVGRELMLRGHQVTLITHGRAAALAEKLGLAFHELDTQDIPDSSPIMLGLAARLCGMDGHAELRDWFRWQAEVVLRLLPSVLKDLAVDGLIVDQVVAAGGTAAEACGIPFVTISSALLWNEEPNVPPSYTGWRYSLDRRALVRNRLGYAAWHWFNRPTLRLINRFRRDCRFSTFEHIDDTYSPLAQISQLCEEFDFPRGNLPETFHYVGSLTADRQDPSDFGFPWDRLDGRPLIFASLGTVPDPANLAVFRKILTACDGLDAQLVLGLGRWNDEEGPVRDQLGKFPHNAVIVDFAPQLALLDRAAVLVTHTGVNTVLESLSRGVPIVALPRSADQPAMGSRIAHAGAGLLGSFWNSRPEQIRALVQQVLADGRFRERAKALQSAMIAAGGLSRAADLAEEALTTGQPVKGRLAMC